MNALEQWFAKVTANQKMESSDDFVKHLFNKPVDLFSYTSSPSMIALHL